MATIKAAMMVSPVPLRVATTAGYVVEFEPDIETFVPALAVRECLKFGAKETKRFRNTGAALPALGSVGAISSQIHSRLNNDGPIEEVELTGHTTSGPQERPTRSETAKDEADVRVGNAILQMIEEADQDDWTGEKPKVSALQKRVKEMSVTASLRDKAFAKLERSDELPENWRVRLGFASGEEFFEGDEYDEDEDEG